MKKNILISVFVLAGMLLFSSAVLAASKTGGGGGGASFIDVCADASMKDLSGIVNWASCFLLKTIVPFLFALATAGFIYGVIQYFLNPDNEEKRKKGKSFIIGGLIALFVMTSMWGIVKILNNTFKTGNAVPQLPDSQ